LPIAPAPFDRSGTSPWAGKADLADCTRSTIAGQPATPEERDPSKRARSRSRRGRWSVPGWATISQLGRDLPRKI